MIKLRAKSFLQVLVAYVGLSLLPVSEVRAQRDVIVTQADEEIRCRILDETPTRFIYAYIGPKGKILRNEIFKNLVKNFNYNQYDSDLVATNFEKDNSKKKRKSKSKSTLKEIEDSKESSQEVVESKRNESVNSVISESGKGSLEPAEPKVSEVIANTTKDEGLKQEPIAQNKVARSEELRANNNVAESPTVTASDKKSDDKSKIDALEKEVNSAKTVQNISPPTELKDTLSKNIEEELLTSSPKVDSTELSKSPEDATVVMTKIPKSPEPVIPDNAVKTTGEYKNYLKWRIGAKAGIGNIRDNTFEATNAFGLYQEKLLKGWTFGADLAFFPMEGFGLGIVYTDFQSSNSASNLNYINQMTGAEASGSISNKISRKFLGPAVFFRKSIDYKTFIVLGVGPGMYFYSDQGAYDGANFDYRGKQIGAAATLGLDFLLGNDIIGRDIILSLEAGYNNGKLGEIDYGDGLGKLLLDINNPINMDRLDFSVGLRFMRFPKYLKK